MRTETLDLDHIAESCRELADHLDGMPAADSDRDDGGDAVDMLSWLKPFAGCGTVGCISGHAVALFDSHLMAAEHFGRGNVAHRARELIGFPRHIQRGSVDEYAHTPEARRLDAVARALMHPPKTDYDQAEIDGGGCAVVLREIADNIRTIGGGGVEAVWREVMESNGVLLDIH